MVTMSQLPIYKNITRRSTHFDRLQPFCTDAQLNNWSDGKFIQMLYMVETRLHSNSYNLKLHYAPGACWFTIATSRLIAMTHFSSFGGPVSQKAISVFIVSDAESLIGNENLALLELRTTN